MAVRPHVVAQVAVSVDGMTNGFAVDQARFYALATLWQEDVTLIGADTVLAEESALRFARPRAPQSTEVRAPGPVLAVVDSRARVRTWESLRGLRYWSEVVALYADQTPARPLDSVIPELVTGYDRVDLVEAMDLLGSKYGARVVRVERAVGGCSGLCSSSGWSMSWRCWCIRLSWARVGVGLRLSVMS